MGADAKLAVADPLRAGHQALSRGGVKGARTFFEPGYGRRAGQVLVKQPFSMPGK